MRFTFGADQQVGPEARHPISHSRLHGERLAIPLKRTLNRGLSLDSKSLIGSDLPLSARLHPELPDIAWPTSGMFGFFVALGHGSILPLTQYLPLTSMFMKAREDLSQQQKLLRQLWSGIETNPVTWASAERICAAETQIRSQEHGTAVAEGTRHAVATTWANETFVAKAQVRA